MHIEYKPWEWTCEIHTDEKGNASGYSSVRADEETRKKQLEEYKKKRIAELELEISKIKSLF